MRLRKILIGSLPEYVVAGYEFAKQFRKESQQRQSSLQKATDLLAGEKPLLLEIGSGPVKGKNGWTTLDRSEKCDICWDLSKPLPFPENSISKIYSSHVLEHFFYPQLTSLLSDCYRVLKPSGIFSVCVPDASIYVQAYLKPDEFQPKELHKPAFHYHTKIDYLNYITYMNGQHRHLFDQ
ncbi:MAG: methyltransferase domain-containing protein, partial [Cyanobacteria bacterium P01_H01_bin.15]